MIFIIYDIRVTTEHSIKYFSSIQYIEKPRKFCSFPTIVKLWC